MKTERRFFNSIVLFLLILTSFGSVFGVRGCLSTVHADSVPKLSARKFTDALTDMTAEYDKNVTQRQAERDPYISERLIVKSTDENLDPDDYGAVDAIHDRNGTYILQFESSGEAKRAAQSIAAEDSTVYVEPDGYLFACDFSDSLNEDLWGTSAAMVGADQYAESLTSSAGSVEVAVLDTGISFTSPKLAGRLDTVRAKSFATYEGDLLNVDQSQESSTELKSRHGTHVAGIIVQCTEALPNVVILPVRVLNNKGAGYVSQVANGIRYAADQKSQGVVLVFNGNVIAGTRARKTFAHSYNAFSSVNFPSLAVIQDRKIIRFIPQQPYSEPVRFTYHLNDSIVVLKLIPGTKPGLVEYLFQNYDCIVIESFGVGGIPDNLREVFYTQMEHWIWGNEFLKSAIHSASIRGA